MTDWTLKELRHTLRDLSLEGFQLWHNRGKLYAAPYSKLSPARQEYLKEHKDLIVETLRREGFPPRTEDALVAPLQVEDGSYAGGMPRKPWQYEVAVMIPNLGGTDLLKAAVSCWRNQTVSPYFLIVDTGSPLDPLIDLDEMRGFDAEIHFIRAHGWRHSSQPVSAAIDLAFALCQTDHMLLTHADVFPKTDGVLEHLLSIAQGGHPVVGYQMSKRHGSLEWLQNVSHTCTMLHMPTMRRERLTWNLLAALEADGELEERYLGWPDTETQFGRSMKAAGVTPYYLGGESNASVYETDLIVHWRSAPSVRHYLPEQRDLRHPGLDPWLAETMARGRAAPLPVFAESESA